MADAVSLLEAVRGEAKPGVWSNGVKLARAGAVVQESTDGKEIILRVKAGGRPVPWTVVLTPAESSWECNCPAPVDPCEHAVAAAITLKEAAESGQHLASVESRYARVVYRVLRVESGVQVHRAVVTPEGAETPLDSLAAALANPVTAKQLQVEQHDLQADRLLEKKTRLALAPERLDAVVAVLQPCRTVLLDGRPVAIAAEPLLPRATVRDEAEQIVVTVERDPRAVEVLAPGLAVGGDTLFRLGEQAFTGAWLEKLPVVKTYPAARAGEVSAQVVPELAKRFPLEVTSARLPRVDQRLEPRVVLEVNQLEQGLSVLPTLVYGAPATVRIDAGRMVHLRGPVPVRDEAKEQRLLHHLRDVLNLVPGRRMTVSGPDAVKFADALRKWRGGLTGDAARKLSPDLKLVPRLTLDDRAAGGVPAVGFSFDFELVGGSGDMPKQVDGEAVLRAWEEGYGLVPIEGGGWAQLPTEFLEAQGARIAALLAAKQENGTLANHALPRLAELCDSLEQPAPLGLEKLRPLAEGFETLPSPSLPADLTATLRPYQAQGVAWLQFLQRAGLGGVLADDMGLGKTLQTICALGPKSLVVCPTSVLPTWLSELRRFRPTLTVNAYHGPNRALDDADVTVTTYAILRLDLSQLQARQWSALVLDEAQNIKNPESQAAKAAFALKAPFRVALSGTPVENRLDELWSLMHFTNQGLLGGRKDFDEKLARPIAEGRQEARLELRRRLRPFVLRRLKRDVAKDLPPRTEIIRTVTLDERERATYDAIYAATKDEVVKLLGQGGSVLKALEALLRLRQAACHPALVPGQIAKTSSKVQTLVEALVTAVADGHKALVFSQWTKLLDLIEPELTTAGVRFSRLDGSTPNRGELTEAFQAEGGPPVMLISLKAGGTGLTLTAADHVFLVDPWWNPAVEAQAADRAHRIGQDKPVMVYRLVSQGTVEERILTLQDKKRSLFEAALGDVQAAGALTKDDLLELFS
ncbi:MAG: DEAD/DEAH box helicase [Myxococcus sp.]|nr:DEAD/DEAH box helicase [Myxococcus sp.]